MRKKRLELKKFDRPFNTQIAEAVYNFSNTKQANTFGITLATFPRTENSEQNTQIDLSGGGVDQVNKVYYFKQYNPANMTSVHRILIHAGDNKIYFNELMADDTEILPLYNLSFSTPPVSIKFKSDDVDGIILADKQQMKVWKTNYAPVSLENAPVITSMAVYDNMLFATISNPAFKVWYTTDFSFTSVNSHGNRSGYLSFDDDLGDCKKVVMFKNDIYVFREYGISKIVKMATRFIKSNIYFSSSKIYTNTVCVVGSKIVFMKSNGLYYFDGLNVDYVDMPFYEYLPKSNDNATAVYFNNLCYIAMRVDYNDGQTILCENNPDYVNNTIIIYDPETKACQIIRGVDVKGFEPALNDKFEKLLLTFNSGNTNIIGEMDSSSRIFGDKLFKMYRTKDLFESNDVKLLTKFEICAKANLDIKFIIDGKEKSLVTTKDGFNTFNFKIPCKKFQIELSTDMDLPEIRSISLEYYENDSEN